MLRITPTNWKKQVKIFEAFGCKFIRQKGDHLIFDKEGIKRPVVIPKYSEVPVTVIKSNMRTAGMTREKYLELLNNI